MMLLWIKLKTSIYNFFEYLKVIWRYYRFPLFRKADLMCVGLYLYNSPFRIAKKFHQERGDEDVYVNGVSP